LKIVSVSPMAIGYPL